jgi:hypothetical protein
MNNNNALSNNQVSLKEVILQGRYWFLYLLKKWKLIFLAGLIGGGLGLAYALMQQPLYTATLSFALDDEKNGGSNNAFSLANQLGFDLGSGGGGIFAGANLIELFKSRAMIEKTLLTPYPGTKENISFAEKFIRDQNWRKKWSKDPVYNNLQFAPLSNREAFSRMQDSVLWSISNDIAVNSLKVYQKDKKIEIIIIETKMHQEEFAKYFTEALAKEVSSFYINTKSQRAKINLEILERQNDSVRRQLNGSITNVAAANDNTFGLNPALTVKRTPSARGQIDVQANTIILTELTKQTELAKVTLRKETPLIQVIDRPIFPLYKEKTGKAKSIVIGGLLLGGLVLLILISRRIIKNVMDSPTA